MNATKALLSITIALGAAGTAIACVLADPPPIVTPPPAERPKIVVDSVSPPLDAILHTAPPCTNAPTDCFVVPVEADPSASLSYRVFVDLDPTGPPTQVAAVQRTDDGGVLAVGPDAGTNGQRLFTFSILGSNFDPTQCHTITLIVAYGFVDNDFSKPITPPGGDTATWFYQPKSDCTFYDAGATD